MPRNPSPDPDERQMKRRPGRGSLADRIGGLSGQTKGPAEPRLIYNGKELFAIIETMIAEGGAVLFGTTSDGGVLTVTLYLGKEKTTNYVGSRDAWLELYYSIVDDEAAPELEGGASQ